MDPKSSEWRPGPTVCRCCFAEGCYKDISTEYFWMGKREVYSEMLSETFDVSIAFSKSGGPNSNSRLICEPCIARLRDASDFKRQVQECERTFMQHLDPGRLPVDIEETAESDKEVKLERVKVEKRHSDDDDDAFDDRQFADNDNDDDDDLDDQPLTKLASKVPKKESVDILDLLDNAKVTVKRKSTSKAKAVPAKKAKTKKEASKPSVSKTQVKPEKKKKELEVNELMMAKRNAQVVLEYSTVYPFRHQGRKMECVYCREGFESSTLFRSHMDIYHKKFNVRTAFHHQRGRHDYLKVDITNLSCRICSQSADTVQEMAQHIYDFHDNRKIKLEYEVGMQPFLMEEDNWICYHCKKKLPSFVSLCRHQASHYRKFTCDVCGNRYNNIEALKYHIRCSHLGIVCRKCWRKFSTNEEKKEHMRTSKSCWNFACIHCGERFLSYELKVRHLEEVHGRPQTVYSCPECDFKHIQRKVFHKHYRSNHTNESYECSCCGLKFDMHYQLNNHRILHTGEKPFVCNICSKSFTRSSNLATHMWIHKETKRFACIICDKQFAQKVAFKNHMKSLHPESLEA